MPLGVTSKAPSGLNESLRKKPLKFSSPYRRIDALAKGPPAPEAAAACMRCCGEGGARIAGRGGIGEGDRILRVREAERLALPPLGPTSLFAAPMCSASLLCDPGARDAILVGGDPTSMLLPLKLDRRLGVNCGGFMACVVMPAWDEKGLGGTEMLGEGVPPRPDEATAVAVAALGVAPDGVEARPPVE